MGREISLFSDYHQRENNLTNHCGVLFRQIYRESPQQFEKLVVELLQDEARLRVGPIFTQQERKLTSVPDLLIQQEAFSLFFETKTSDWFYHDQLSRHVEVLAKAPGIKVLFCLSKFDEDEPEEKFTALIAEAKKQKVVVQFVSFEDLLEQVRQLRLSSSGSDPPLSGTSPIQSVGISFCGAWGSCIGRIREFELSGSVDIRA